MKKTMLIINPSAGMGRGERCGREVIKLAQENGIEFKAVFTESPEEYNGRYSATTLAEEGVKEGYEPIIAVGGDGIVNEVAKALIGSNTSIGIVPAGVGNDFARALRIPRRTKAAFNVIQQGKIVAVDVGKVKCDSCPDGRIFVNVLSFGFDTQIAQYVEDLKRDRFLPILPKTGVYLMSFFKGLTFPVESFQVQVIFPEKGIREIQGRITGFVVSNGPQYGGIFKIAPEANLIDGLLDVCWLKEISKARLLTDLLRILRGTHIKLPEAETIRVSSLIISSSEKLISQIDGDIFESEKEYEISMLPQALKVLVP